MNPAKRKLLRLTRLERIRAVAKQTAAAEAAHAESTLAQLEALSARTSALAADYAARGDARDGGDLRRLGSFVGGLQGLRASTEADVARARVHADHRQSELAAAERRRAAVEDRAIEAARDLAARAQSAALEKRRQIGTDLD